MKRFHSDFRWGWAWATCPQTTRWRHSLWTWAVNTSIRCRLGCRMSSRSIWFTLKRKNRIFMIIEFIYFSFFSRRFRVSKTNYGWEWIFLHWVHSKTFWQEQKGPRLGSEERVQSFFPVRFGYMPATQRNPFGPIQVHTCVRACRCAYFE